VFRRLIKNRGGGGGEGKGGRDGIVKSRKGKERIVKMKEIRKEVYDRGCGRRVEIEFKIGVGRTHKGVTQRHGLVGWRRGGRVKGEEEGGIRR
jgi:hypothetical protein